jgi:hypothetical protein
MSRHYRDYRAPRSRDYRAFSEDRRHDSRIWRQDESKPIDRHRPRTKHRTTPYQQSDHTSYEHRRQSRHQDYPRKSITQLPANLSAPVEIPAVPVEIPAVPVEIPATDPVETTTESVPVSVFDLLNSLSSIDFDGFKQCKGCNPPEILSDKYPGYYDEPCTCTYCPSCDPLEEDGCEYDPVFPFYNGPSCTCTTVDNE